MLPYLSPLAPAQKRARGHVVNLEDLDVSYNNVEKIAYDIGEMASLTNFNLYSN